MGEHTPGPWTYSRGITKLYIDGPDDKTVAVVDDGNEADAALLASAPALADALRACVPMMEALLTLMAEETRAVLAQARAALGEK